MIKNWITWVNRVLIGLIAFFILLTFWYQFSRPSEIPVPKHSHEKMLLPKGTFAKEKEQYDAIGTPFLQLRFSPMSLQLPDLRSYLVYYGRNERPDADEGESMLHFAFAGTKEVASVKPGEPLYLVYDKDRPRVKYLFSPDNRETSLWIEGSPREKEVIVNVSMKNEAGQVIRKPEKFAQFTLKEKRYTRFAGNRWEIGKWKVDGTLLARQRARWYGKDLFLERHGGEEFKEAQDKQRVDFGEKDERYSVYLGEGDAVAWVDGKWKQIVAGEGSVKYPILVLDKIDQRLMKFSLWEVGGKGKVSLNVIKSSEASPMRNLEKQFKFVGARTRSQFMFEINGERVLISPKDWLLNVQGSWVKLVDPDQIDAYVQRKLVGPLFVVDEIVREDGRQVLLGLLYNSTRTGVQIVEIPLQQGSTAVIKELEKSPPPSRILKNAEGEKEDELEKEYKEKVKDRYKGLVPKEYLERFNNEREGTNRWQPPPGQNTEN